MRELIQAEQALGDYTRKHARHIIAGELGNNAGTVDHPTRLNFVYVKLHGDDNQVVEAEAVASFPHQAGIIVAVELVKRNAASRYQVLGIASNIMFVGSIWAGTVGEHAEQHQRRDLGEGGFDPLDIYNRALVNLRGRAQATPDFTLYVERGFYFIGGALYEWTGGNSAAFTVPVGSFGVTVRRCDLLYIGSDQALHIVQGATTSDGSVPAYPTTPYPCIPIAYVYLTSSSTSIQEDNIKDARVILTASDGTPVAHNLLSATHGDTLAASVVAGDLIIGNDTPKWSRLAITVPAANVRNVVGVDNGETKPSWKVALDGTTPADIAGTAAAGTSLVFPHRDHVHRGVLSINKAADTTLYGAVTLSAGANITLTQVGQDIAIAAAGGAGAHDILSATHSDTLADTVVDGDIIIGNATPKWSRLAISVPAANVRNVLSIDNAELRPSWKAALDATNPATLTASAAAAPGTSLIFAHRDHVHPITNTAIGVASTLMSTNASGGTTLTGLEVINTNAAAAPAVWPGCAGTTLQIVPADNAFGGLELNGYGTNKFSSIVFRHARGTLASPSATQLGDELGAIQCIGYGATGFPALGRANMSFVPSENWTDSAQGTYIDFVTTPTGGTSTTTVFYIYGDGSARAVGNVRSKPAAASAGIAIDHNSATGDYLLSLSPANLTADRRVTFPNQDLTFSSNPGAASAALMTNASGIVQLAGLGVGVAPGYTVEVAGTLAVRYANPDVTGMYFQATTGTNAVAFKLTNTGNSFFGRDNSTSGRISGSGNAYDTCMWVESNTNFVIGTNNAVRVTVNNAGTVTLATIPAFAAGDKYLVVDANGNIHKSALGPAS